MGIINDIGSLQTTAFIISTVPIWSTRQYSSHASRGSWPQQRSPGARTCGAAAPSNNGGRCAASSLQPSSASRRRHPSPRRPPGPSRATVPSAGQHARQPSQGPHCRHGGGGHGHVLRRRRRPSAERDAAPPPAEPAREPAQRGEAAVPSRADVQQRVLHAAARGGGPRHPE